MNNIQPIIDPAEATDSTDREPICDKCNEPMQCEAAHAPCSRCHKNCVDVAAQTYEKFNGEDNCKECMAQIVYVCGAVIEGDHATKLCGYEFWAEDLEHLKALGHVGDATIFECPSCSGACVVHGAPASSKQKIQSRDFCHDIEPPSEGLSYSDGRSFPELILKTLNIQEHQRQMVAAIVKVGAK